MMPSDWCLKTTVRATALALGTLHCLAPEPAFAVCTTTQPNTIVCSGTSNSTVGSGPSTPSGTSVTLQANAQLSVGNSHLAEELLNRDLGIDMKVVAYRGASQQLTDIMGGHVAAGASPVPGAYPYIEGGRLRALAVTSPQRLSILPDVPTVAETDVPGFEFSSWYGLWGPADMDDEVVRSIHAAVHKALSSETIRRKFEELMVQHGDDTPQALRAKVQNETRLVRQLVEDNGIKIQ